MNSNNTINNVLTTTILGETEKKKRGRKKQENTINCLVSEKNSIQSTNNDEVIIKKKRTRKSKDSLNSTHENESNNEIDNENNNKINEKISKKKNKKNKDGENIIIENSNNEMNTNVPKKRGRKPKGGKITTQQLNDNNNDNEMPNIILHLKCSLSDLSNPQPNLLNSFEANISNEDIQGYNSNDVQGAEIKGDNSSNDFTIFNNNNDKISNDVNKNQLNNLKYTPCIIDNNNLNNNNLNTNQSFFTSQLPINFSGNNELDNTREIWKKINQLKISFHKSDICQNGGTQRSACFWCTYDFESPPIYIPKFSVKDTFHVYGCFCSPECAAAFLMNENIDTSTKFERYHLLNSLYGKIYKYEKSIKIAPNPFYLLNKFYGNLTINEYRKLFKSDQMIYVVNKPLTHILPELYEDNNDFLLNNKVIPQNTMNIRTRPQMKNNIISEAFGITVNN